VARTPRDVTERIKAILVGEGDDVGRLIAIRAELLALDEAVMSIWSPHDSALWLVRPRTVKEQEVEKLAHDIGWRKGATFGLAIGAAVFLLAVLSRWR
jgi:hypothetical protein